MDQVNTQDGWGGLSSIIGVDTNVVSRSLDHQTHSNAHGSGATIGTSSFSIVNCIVGTKVAVGIGNVASLNTIHSFMSISLLR